MTPATLTLIRKAEKEIKMNAYSDIRLISAINLIEVEFKGKTDTFYDAAYKYADILDLDPENRANAAHLLSELKKVLDTRK